MKKLLIGTTALVAGGLIAGSALAADLIPAPAPEIIDDGFTVTWNGFIRSGFYGSANDCTVGIGQAGFDVNGAANVGAAGVVSECVQRGGSTDSAVDTDGTMVPVDGELQLFAEQTLANGLRVGGEIDFGLASGEGGNVMIDELWIFVEGPWGEIRLGQKDGASDALSGGDLPGWGVWNGSTNGPDMNPLGGLPLGASTTGDFEDFSGDQLKVTYYTPSIAGFEFGVSYTPDADDDNFATGTSADTNGTAANLRADALEFGAKYTGTIGAYALNLGFAYATDDAENNNTTVGDRELWKVAGSVKSSMGGVGAFYSHRDTDTLAATLATADKETTVWGVVANYIWGDYTIGGGYTNVEDEKVNNVVGQNHTDDELDIWGFGIAQSLGTGVEIGANAIFMDATNSFDTLAAPGVNTATSMDGWTGGVYIGIAF